jgi:hypothetical protein
LGDCLVWQVFVKNKEISQIFGATLFHTKSYVLILTKKDIWAMFWAILAQTHLVKLLATIKPGSLPSQEKQTNCKLFH